MRITEHLELLRTDIELTLRELHPYRKDTDVDKEGVELKLTKQGYYVAKDFKPFWECD